MPWTANLLVDGRKTGVTLHDKTTMEELLDMAESLGFTILQVRYIPKGEKDVRCIIMPECARGAGESGCRLHS